ncbi:MAG: hypothetical protein N2747_09855 [Chitinophagaceae bacterium]|nr:hypothetical protein [Chitinophagaceae bacterium]
MENLKAETSGDIFNIQEKPVDILSTPLPSRIAFIAGLFLFFMPFIHIKCNEFTLRSVSGFQLATGFQIKKGLEDVGEAKSEGKENIAAKKNNSEKSEPNLFALAALLLALSGTILAFLKYKGAIPAASAAALGAAASLVLLLFDLNEKVKARFPGYPSSNRSDTKEKIEEVGSKLADSINIRLEYTVWFFLTLLLLLAAALFGFLYYRQMQKKKDYPAAES